MFRHDLRHTGYSTSRAPSINTTAWKYTTGGEVRSSPAVVDGVLFIGSNDKKVYALNETTGKKIWKYTTGGEVRSSPAVVDGVVYVGSYDNNMYALNATTGSKIWNYTTGGAVYSSPAVVDGVVFVGSNDMRIYALNQSTGEQVWNYTTQASVVSSPAVIDGVVFVGSYDNNMYALNATTGSKIWNSTIGISINCSPTVVGGVVFLTSTDGGGRVYALNQSTGSPIWNYTTGLGSAYDPPPAVAYGMVFAGLDDHMYALNQSTGEQVWNYTTGTILYSSPSVADGLVFVGSWWPKKVYALNKTSGALVWSYTTGDTVPSSPAVADGHVFVGSSDGKVYCFGPMLTDTWPMFRHDPLHTGYSFGSAPTTNDTRWFYTTGGWVYSSPAVTDGVVFVGSSDDRMYALDQSTGQQIWNYTTGGDIMASPAVADGMVFLGSLDAGRIYAINQSAGQQVWNYTTEDPLFGVYSSPTVAGGMVFVGSHHKVYALNEITGSKIWSYTTGGEVRDSPAVADGVVFVGSYDKNVYALNATTGSKIWNYTTGDQVLTSPAVADGMVFVGSYDKNVYALNATTGSKVWNYTTGTLVHSSPAVADGMVFVGSDDCNVYALNETTGSKIWNYTTGDVVWSSPAVAYGMVFIGSNDNNVYALDEITGSKIWSYTTGDAVASSPAVANGMVFVGSYDNNTYCFSPVAFSPAVLYEEETTVSLFHEILASWSLNRSTLQDPWFNFNHSFLNDGENEGVTLDIAVLVDIGFVLTADVPISIVTVVPEAVPKNSSFNFMIKLAQKPTSLTATFWFNLNLSLSGSYNFTALVQNITNTGRFPQELKNVLGTLTVLTEAMDDLTDFLKLVTEQNITDWLAEARQKVSSIRSRLYSLQQYVDKDYSIHLGYGRISRTITVNPWNILPLAQYINDVHYWLSQLDDLLASMAGAVGEVEDLVDSLLALIADFPTGSFNYMLGIIDFTKTLNGVETLYGNFSLPLGDFVFDLRNDLPSAISEKINELTRMMYIQTLLATPVTVDALFDIGVVPQLSVSAWMEGNVTANGANITNPSFTLKNYSDYANIQAHSYPNQTQPIELSISNLRYKTNASFSLVPFVDLYLQVPYLTIPLVNIVELLPENVTSHIQFVVPITEIQIPISGTVERSVILLAEHEGKPSGFTISEKTINQTIVLIDWNEKKDPLLSFGRSFFTYGSSDGLHLGGDLLLDTGLNVNFSLPLRFRQIVPNLGVPGRAFTMSTQLVPTNPEIQVHFWVDVNVSLSASWNLETILQNITNDMSYPSSVRNLASDLLTILSELSQALDYLDDITSWSTSTLIGYLEDLESALDGFWSKLDSYTYSITISIRILYYYNPVTGTKKYYTFSHTFSFNFLDALTFGSSYLRSLISGAISSINSLITALKNGITTAESVALGIIDLLGNLTNFLMDGSFSPTINLLDIDFNEVYNITQVYGHPLRLPIGLHSYDLRYDLPEDFVVNTTRTKLGMDALTHFYVSFSIVPAPVTVDLIADVDLTPVLKALGNITGKVTTSNALFETVSGPKADTDCTLSEYDEAVWLEGKLNPEATSNFSFTFKNFTYNLEANLTLSPSVEFLLDIPLLPIPIKILDLYDLIDPVEVSFPVASINVPLEGSFKETILNA